MLDYYKDKGYIINKRATFLTISILLTIIVAFASIVTTIYTQSTSPEYDRVHIGSLLPIMAVMFIAIFALFELRKGKYKLSSHLFLISSFAVVWLVLFVDKNVGFSKVNTIVYIYGVMAMLPLILTSGRQIVIYGLSNFACFIVYFTYLYYHKAYYDMSTMEYIDTLFDISITLGFVIAVHYTVHVINNAALKNAEEQIYRGEKLTQELRYHRDNLEKIVSEKTQVLEKTNDELSDINQLVLQKNEELNQTLSELKETQAQLLQADKMASLGTLTAGVAHEINNPLNFIMSGYVSLSKYFTKYGSEDKKSTDLLLTSIKEGVDRASNIVIGLNEFSRESSNVNEFCDLHAIISNNLMMLKPKLAGINLCRQFHDQQIFIAGNIGQLHQVFVNLFSNAIHAVSGKGNIGIRTTVNENKAIVEISDNGYGISKEHLPQVTDPFFTTKPPGEGTGLGLSITYTIVKEHKGAMEIYSRKNEGTTVRLKFPLKIVS